MTIFCSKKILLKNDILNSAFKNFNILHRTRVRFESGISRENFNGFVMLIIITDFINKILHHNNITT